jgi:hypothetical protein
MSHSTLPYSFTIFSNVSLFVSYIDFIILLFLLIFFNICFLYVVFSLNRLTYKYTLFAYQSQGLNIFVILVFSMTYECYVKRKLTFAKVTKSAAVDLCALWTYCKSLWWSFVLTYYSCLAIFAREAASFNKEVSSFKA